MRGKITTLTGSRKVDQCSLFREKALNLKPEQEVFPGGPVAKTPVLPAQGTWVQSLVRELDSMCCH